MVIGTREEVWEGSASKTSGGLTKADLSLNTKTGKVVSTKQSQAAKDRYPAMVEKLCKSRGFCKTPQPNISKSASITGPPMHQAHASIAKPSVHQAQASIAKPHVHRVQASIAKPSVHQAHASITGPGQQKMASMRHVEHVKKLPKRTFAETLAMGPTKKSILIVNPSQQSTMANTKKHIISEVKRLGKLSLSGDPEVLEQMDKLRAQQAQIKAAHRKQINDEIKRLGKLSLSGDPHVLEQMDKLRAQRDIL